MQEYITSRVGTWLDAGVFARLNAACAAEPEPQQKYPKICKCCGKKALSRGMCTALYYRWLRADRQSQLQRREQYLTETGKQEQYRREFKQEEHVNVTSSH